MITHKNLELLKWELQFIRRQLAQIEGANSSDYTAVDEIDMSAINALRVLHEYELSLQAASEEIPADLPQAA